MGYSLTPIKLICTCIVYNNVRFTKFFSQKYQTAPFPLAKFLIVKLCH